MQLEVISAEIVELQRAVHLAQRSQHRTMAMVQVTIGRIVIAGDLLLKHRGELENGDWGDWLAANLPDFTPRTAQRWMKLAQFAQRHGQDLESAQSITQAYKLAGLLPEGESQAGPGVNRERAVLNGLTRLAEDLLALPVERMGREDKLLLSRRLEPYVTLYERLQK